MREPRRDHYIAPSTGADSRSALDTALDELAAARNLDTTDAATAVHLLASLAAETDARFSEMIANARKDGCSWAEIADLLGVTRASAWQRWGRPDRHTAGASQPDRQAGRQPTPKSPPKRGTKAAEKKARSTVSFGPDSIPAPDKSRPHTPRTQQ